MCERWSSQLIDAETDEATGEFSVKKKQKKTTAHDTLHDHQKYP